MKLKQFVTLSLAGGLLLSPIAGNFAVAEETSQADQHQHNHSHEKLPHQEGIFEDDEVKDRDLSDWSGDWQSVFPYLENGTLDPVMEAKAEDSDDMSAEDYKEYYTKGYETDVDRIVIDGETGEVTFYRGEESVTGVYEYDGYTILTYESGKKGVRYQFTATEESDPEAPKYFQFSDHEISPTKVGHYHIYWGDSSHEEINEELTNWPTYYPSDMSADDILHEMLYH